jgi:2-polyprenyl-3-methyl-5-hydroxy-6-metoxy-1,4-benzoquinol methylase
MAASTNQVYDNYFNLRGVSASVYDNYRLPLYLQQQLPANMGASVLDIGCGYGQMLNALKSKGYSNLNGIELLPEAAEHCNTKLGLNVTCTEDIQTFATGHKARYDLILMSHVLEHLPKADVIPILGAIKSMLTPTGKFIVMVPNGQAPTHSYWMWEDFTHNTLFTAGSLTYVLKAAGFSQITFLDPYDLQDKTFVKRVFKRLFQRIYALNKKFWNSINSSGYHYASPVIYTWELKVSAT